jgi:hypothetical protein
LTPWVHQPQPKGSSRSSSSLSPKRTICAKRAACSRREWPRYPDTRRSSCSSMEGMVPIAPATESPANVSSGSRAGRRLPRRSTRRCDMPAGPSCFRRARSHRSTSPATSSSRCAAEPRRSGWSWPKRTGWMSERSGRARCSRNARHRCAASPKWRDCARGSRTSARSATC